MGNLNNKQLIDNTRKLITDGKYVEAYEYIIGHKHLDNENAENIYCLRFLLACITGNKVVGVNKFDNKMNGCGSEFPKDVFSNIELDIICKDRIFHDLVDICKGKMKKNI